MPLIDVIIIILLAAVAAASGILALIVTIRDSRKIRRCLRRIDEKYHL